MTRRGKKATLRERVSRANRRRARRSRRRALQQEVVAPFVEDLGDAVNRGLRRTFRGIVPMSAADRMDEMWKGQQRRTRRENERKAREAAQKEKDDGNLDEGRTQGA